MHARTRKSASHGLVRAGRRAALVLAASAAVLGASIGPATAAGDAGHEASSGRPIGAGAFDVPDPNLALPPWPQGLVPGPTSARPAGIQMYRPVVHPAATQPAQGAMTRAPVPHDPTWTVVPAHSVVGPSSSSGPVASETVHAGHLVPPEPTWTVMRPHSAAGPLTSATRHSDQQPPQDPTWT